MLIERSLTFELSPLTPYQTVIYDLISPLNWCKYKNLKQHCFNEYIHVPLLTNVCYTLYYILYFWRVIWHKQKVSRVFSGSCFGPQHGRQREGINPLWWSLSRMVDSRNLIVGMVSTWVWKYQNKWEAEISIHVEDLVIWGNEIYINAGIHNQNFITKSSLHWFSTLGTRNRKSAKKAFI